MNSSSAVRLIALLIALPILVSCGRRGRDDPTTVLWPLMGEAPESTDTACSAPPEPGALVLANDDGSVRGSFARPSDGSVDDEVPGGRCPVDAVWASAIGTVASEPATSPASAPVADGIGTREVDGQLRAWAAAWSAKDADRYLALYSPDFRTETLNHAAWRTQRTRLLGKPGAIKVELDHISTRAIGPDELGVSFTQTYVSDNFQDRVAKTLTWRRVDGQWVIVGETLQK